MWKLTVLHVFIRPYNLDYKLQRNRKIERSLIEKSTKPVLFVYIYDEMNSLRLITFRRVALSDTEL